MCGIFGITKNGLESEHFDTSVQAMKHRGPDYTGTFEDNSILVAHVLLAIRGNTTESIQPVKAEGSPWVLAFNGQLYNTTTIRTALGVSAPQSSVDTTLLYALIQKYGWSFIEHVHGMFAIALYHTEEKVIRIYRDQSGQKNLYYSLYANRFVCASELKSICALPHIPHTIDRSSLLLATSIGYIPGNQTLVQNVFKLLPSEELTYNLNTKAVSKRIYSSKGEDEYAGMEPDEALKTVINDHLQSKHEISINLSGGLDSSLIFHEAVRSGRQVHAFSTSFENADEGYNTDADLAKKLAHDYGQTFTPIHITKESYLANLIDAYAHIEEPNYNISVPIYYETAKREGVNGEGLRVVLSGDGGDELFGGYPHYRGAQNIEILKKRLTPLVYNLYKKFRYGSTLDYRTVSDLFLHFRAFTKSWLIQNHTTPLVQAYLKEITRDYISTYACKKDDVYSLMLLDRCIWLASENFIRSDKLYMSQSMEMRCPLAYTPLRTYMDAHIPSSEYISREMNKKFLRNLYDRKLPDYITKRQTKTGWRAPVETWYDNSYKKRFLEILGEVDTSIDCIDWTALRKQIETRDTWPGKTAHLYLSLAILIDRYKLS